MDATPTPDTRSPDEDLTALFSAGRVLVLTGAGISTDSGIPAYRGSDGQPRNPAPMTFAHFAGSALERRRYWARSHVGWEQFARARPNVTHLAVAALERAGALSCVVTQNVDGLHAAAGSSRVIDLHGRLDVVVCLGCGVRRPRLEVGLRLDVVNPGFRRAESAERDALRPDRDALRPDRDALRPDGDIVLDDDAVATFRMVDCRHCGGLLKPDVVYFGEHVPRERFRAAMDHLEESDALVVLGSSLAVGSGYRFVTAARTRGLGIAIVTRGVTRADHLADLRIDAPLASVLPPVAAAVTAAVTS